MRGNSARPVRRGADGKGPGNRNLAGGLPYRAASVLTQHAHESAEAILDALTEAVNRWGTPADDLTILVCRRVPTD
jgi:hypothetical protein